MQESPFYESVMQRGEQRGIELGREQGIELGEKRGIERGIERGARQTSIESTLNVFTHRFPSADANALKDMLEAIDDLDRPEAGEPGCLHSTEPSRVRTIPKRSLADPPKPIKRMNNECDRDPFFPQNSVSRLTPPTGNRQLTTDNCLF